MINVKSSTDARAKLQNGFWGFKVIVLAGLVVGSFWIPNGDFDYALMLVGLIGGFLVSGAMSVDAHALTDSSSSFSCNYFCPWTLYIRTY